MLYHAGSILRLSETTLLGELDRVSSVSGGSITAGLLAMVWARNGGIPSAAVIGSQLIEPLLDLSTKFIDIPAFVIGTLLPWSSPGRQLAGALDQHLYKGFTLGELPQAPAPEFVFNATNLGTGVLWRFSKESVGDYQVGFTSRPGIKLATAVGASSAFPPFFTPFTLRLGSGAPWRGAHLRAEGRDAFRKHADLGDGGIYDNLGLEAAWKEFETILVSDGGGTYNLEANPPADFIRLAIRVTETIDHQVRSLRLRQIGEGLGFDRPNDPPETKRPGALWTIRTPYSKYDDRFVGIEAPKERTDELAHVATSIRGLKPDIARRIVNWGYLITDAAIRTYMKNVTLDDPALPFKAEGI